MYTKFELDEDLIAQRFDDNEQLVENVTIPKGTKLRILDMGDCAEVLEPEEYKGLMFLHEELKDVEDETE
jgi:hypothetical protein